MRIERLRSVFLALALGWLQPAFYPAFAQGFPDRPVRIVVPSPPGGGYDFIGRLLAERMSPGLGQPMVVDNRTGGGTLAGTQSVATAAPDGYTLVVGGLANMAFNPVMFGKPGYSAADFVPVALVASFTYALVGRADLPYKTLKEVIEHARANPGRLTVATAGTGSGQHISAVLLKRLAKVDILEVPFKGAQAAYTEVIGGRVDLFFDNTTTARPLVEGGRLKAYTTSGSQRDALLPNVPTGREAGVEGLEIDSWIGLFAPARTPAPVIERLRSTLKTAVDEADTRKRLETGGWRAISQTPAETTRFVAAEVERWTSFLRQAGIKAD